MWPHGAEAERVIRRGTLRVCWGFFCALLEVEDRTCATRGQARERDLGGQANKKTEAESESIPYSPHSDQYRGHIIL